MTKFDIDCPLCACEHSYDIEVVRTMIFKHMGFNDVLDFNEKPKPVKFTRILVCPNRNEKFRATLRFYETSHEKISSVEVKGIIDDNNNSNDNDDDNEES